ncbi:hypothetical protein B0H17DRAFT_550293 [Mycena rosella]|uniref:Uncharacterized protein n=1 Tax=Mycena rosella TaxID=1033263 RepID=A0AAD7FKL6_MYCRO|nr:hypothetical protein B0H17DRAFT_550293 [Mycena rosella]
MHNMSIVENRDGGVSDHVRRIRFLYCVRILWDGLQPVLKVVCKLGNATLSSDLVDAYLSDIAKAYGVERAPPPAYVEATASNKAPEGTSEASPLHYPHSHLPPGARLPFPANVRRNTHARLRRMNKPRV